MKQLFVVVAGGSKPVENPLSFFLQIKVGLGGVGQKSVLEFNLKTFWNVSLSDLPISICVEGIIDFVRIEKLFQTCRTCGLGVNFLRNSSLVFLVTKDFLPSFSQVGIYLCLLVDLLFNLDFMLLDLRLARLVILLLFDFGALRFNFRHRVNLGKLLLDVIF